jgi:hypothetical protein
VNEKSLEMSHYQAFRYPKKAPLAASPGPPNSLRGDRMEKTASAEAARCRIEGAQDAKKEILDKPEFCMQK